MRGGLGEIDIGEVGVGSSALVPVVMGVAACQGQPERPLCPGAAEGRPECAAQASAPRPLMIGILSASICITSNLKKKKKTRTASCDLIKAAPAAPGRPRGPAPRSSPGPGYFCLPPTLAATHLDRCCSGRRRSEFNL